MTAQQRAALDAMLRDGPLDFSAGVAEQRAAFETMLASQPLPDDVTWTENQRAGVPVIEFRITGRDGAGVLLYVHGGAFAVGTARGTLGLVTDVARRANLHGVSVDYRLAPEHPYPAGLDDVVAVYRDVIGSTDPARLVVVGESAGATLVLALLITLRDAGTPLPAAAAVFSPVGDLTLGSATMRTKADVDPVITVDGLRARAADYLVDTDPRTPTVSPVFADFTGLPPLLIQAGTHEVLLDDAVRLAGAAARDDVDVRLDVVAGVPHVFQGFAATLDEGAAALDRAAVFLTDHVDPKE